MKIKGFTLIEVLIVVIIIGILATLAMPRIRGVMERARTAEAKLSMDTIRTSLMMACEEANGEFPDAPATSDNPGLRAALGEVIPVTAGTHFNYTYTVASIVTTKDEATVYAERNQLDFGGSIANAPHAQLKMVVNNDGTADEIEIHYPSGAVPATDGACASGW